MGEYKRGHRAELELYIDPIDYYMDNKEEIEKVINSLSVIPEHYLITQEVFMSSAWKEGENDEY